MKKLFAVMALVLSVSAFAAQEKISFTYLGFENWGRTYYHCDYAEAQTEKFLALFGATEINVRCTGGIEHGHLMPVRVTATFEAPVLVGNEVPEVTTVKGSMSNPSCGLNTAIVKKLLPSFSNVTVLAKNDRCSSSTSNYSYRFSITK